ncbi:ABC transporter ATP-binding protein [Desulfosporosinus sp. OT]|uniref:ABC transporter ATP-binding protein n=1 Tax=Desulfosporosinus sp. OT TaxID=913865 RepID=UPI000223AB05|nr:ABC transporter ATP-binding protein [Desulfosporosinus sp. OT]EGW36925.1 ABC transporter family protein [Desulfosporosinus sp. OT]
MEKAMCYIRFENIEKSFDDRKVLDNINISIEQGEFITLLGPSGCGKTTLLRCLAGLVRVDSGKIFLDNRDITYALPKERNLNMIFQQYSLFPTMTVAKNIAFGLKMQKLEQAEIKRRVANALEMVDLVRSENKYPGQLSGGEQQRVALARSIVTKSKVLLLDEPFSAIDAKLRKALQIKIKEIHHELGMTTIFVTHDQEEAMRMSDRIYLINNGKVGQMGSPMDLYLNPETTFAASFMGHCNLLSHEVFQQVTASEHVKKGFYAIRPENIGMTLQENTKHTENNYYVKGIVKRIIPQGNIIRYTILVNGNLIDVDTLFEVNNQFARNSEVYLSIDKELIIFFDSV